MKLTSNVRYCPECGISTTGQPNYSQTQSIIKSNKNPLLAATLSFLIIGLGQIYLGLTKKGIKLFLLSIISGFLMLIFIGYILWLFV